MGGDVRAFRPGSPSHNGVRVQIDDAVIAEGGIRFSGLRVERVQFSVARSENDLRGRFRVAGPVLKPARGGIPGWERMRPEFFSSNWIERHHSGIWGGDIHDPANHERRDFAWAEARAKLKPAVCSNLARFRFISGSAAGSRGRTVIGWLVTRRPHMINPRYFELTHVVRRDLLQRRESHTTRIVTIGWPLHR